MISGELRAELEKLQPYLKVKPLYYDYETNEFVWLDTSLIPYKEEYKRSSSYRDVARAIKEMEIRGAPAIGVAAAYGLALATLELVAKDSQGFLESLAEAKRRLESTSPTAVNLFWALDRVWKAVTQASEKGGGFSGGLVDVEASYTEYGVYALSRGVVGPLYRIARELFGLLDGVGDVVLG